LIDFRVVDETFSMANVRREDIDAIAITTKPGLSGSLSSVTLNIYQLAIVIYR
jgi:tRNA A37 threonylcarbamoyltransferase TsaD